MQENITAFWGHINNTKDQRFRIRLIRQSQMGKFWLTQRSFEKNTVLKKQKPTQIK